VAGVSHDAAGNVGVLIEVVAGTHSVITIRDLQGNSHGQVTTDQQDR
jgi:hypothetical protein